MQKKEPDDNKLHRRERTTGRGENKMEKQPLQTGYIKLLFRIRLHNKLVDVFKKPANLCRKSRVDKTVFNMYPKKEKER